MLSLCASSIAQTTRKADVRTFELTAVAPPTPALKHQLLFSFAERIPGNAAIAYLDAILLMGPDTGDKTEKALEAYDAKDMKAFETLARELDLASMFDELDVAGRRERCDWQPPIREKGVMTLLPHLSPLAHGVTRSIKVRALRQIQRGELPDALATLRLGYEMADRVGQEPVLVSALVSLRISSWMHDTLAQLMNHRESPNLYWALSEIPSRQLILRRAWDAEHRWLLYSSPDLATVHAGGKLTAEQWRKVLIDDMAPVYQIYEDYKHAGQRPHPHPIRDASPQVLRQAKDHYAKAHDVPVEQAEAVDPAVALGSFYFRHWQVVTDEIGKLRGLPYPLLLSRTANLRAPLERLRVEQPANPFMELVADLQKAVASFAAADRQLAALRAVEAVRSYAAAHDGQLPQRLEDVSDTPVPDNPATGKPFDYRLENEVATLSDSTLEPAMTYTIRIRK
jgi:hypothetical protein